MVSQDPEPKGPLLPGDSPDHRPRDGALQSMVSAVRSLTTPDGYCDVHLFSPDPSPGPAIVFFMDAGGVRPTLLAMAERLARYGYGVALPDLYYRAGPYAPADPGAAFEDGPERARLRRLASTISPEGLARDTDAVLAMLEAEGASRIGCVGYCMGGRCALAAAASHGPRIACAASIHGAGLAREASDSPHHGAASMRAEVYVGVAGRDPYFDEAERVRLAAALAAAGVRHSIETYPGVGHGFAVPDNPSFDPEAAERHWQRLLALCARTLR